MAYPEPPRYFQMMESPFHSEEVADDPIDGSAVTMEAGLSGDLAIAELVPIAELSPLPAPLAPRPESPAGLPSSSVLPISLPIKRPDISSVPAPPGTATGALTPSLPVQPNKLESANPEEPRTPCTILLCISSYQRHTFKQHRVTVHHPSEDAAWDDHRLFLELRTAYNSKLRSFWQRFLSLKGLKHIGLLQYTPTTRPTEVSLSPFASQDLLSAFKRPEDIPAGHEWIDWIFELKTRQDEIKFALTFVQGWEARKIMVLGMIPWVASCVTAVAWSVAGGNVQNAVAVASFILTASGGILALLAILSSLEK